MQRRIGWLIVDTRTLSETSYFNSEYIQGHHQGHRLLSMDQIAMQGRHESCQQIPRAGHG
eukprot:3097511-Karenia_brevis.AAC.1